MRRLLLLAVLPALACGPLKLHATEGGLQIDDAPVALPRTFVGFPTHARVRVRNSSPATLTLRASIEPPFSVEAETRIDPASSFDLSIGFDPRAVGPFASTLKLQTGEGEVDVAVSGTAELAPGCTASACHSAVFDPASGSCVVAPQPDGTSCGDACLEDASCRGGACVGSPRSCDDGDVCTADACSAEQGCLHTDLTPSCPAPGDPCKVATCDPGSGCGVGDAPDGTVCGSVDCVTANVCLHGSCVAVPVPDGYECAAKTPCQDHGVCHGGACEQPDAGVMVPVWSYAPDAGSYLIFDGVLDGQSNLYWAECVDSACDLVSATRDGFIRYRQALSGDAGWVGGVLPGELARLSSGTLVSTAMQGFIEGRADRDGAALWSWNWMPMVLDAVDGGAVSVYPVSPPVEGSAGQLLVALRVQLGGPAPGYQSWLASLDGATGALGWLVPIAGYVGDPIGDGAGTIFFTRYQDPTMELVAMGEDGQVRWSVPATISGPLAASGGRLVDQVGGLLEVRSVADGAQLASTEINAQYGLAYGETSPVLQGATLYAGGICVTGACDDGGYGTRLFAVDAPSGATAWTYASPETTPSWQAFTELQATSRGTLLLLDGSDYGMDDVAGPVGPRWMEEVDGQGGLRWSCELPEAPNLYGDYIERLALGRERAFVARQWGSPNPVIEAYDLAGATPALHGWMAPGGNPGRTHRPLGP